MKEVTNMNKKIINKLKEIEKQENIEIIFAIESGSRAWGFAGNDSDYDVRFIYKRKLKDYLFLNKSRDVIEYPVDEQLDISGWDLDKTLKLAYNSNPALLEWINSPIIYIDNNSIELRDVINKYFSQSKIINHYYHIALEHYNNYIKGKDEFNIKKYFYVLRNLLSANYVSKFNKMPPIKFDELRKEGLSDSMNIVIDELVEIKKNSSESKMITKIDEIELYINDTLNKIDSIRKTYNNQEDADWEDLNGIFLKMIDDHENKDKNKYIYVEYLDNLGGRMYCYTSEQDYNSGDIVLVPRGWNNEETEAKVITTKYYNTSEAPYPFYGLKQIYGRIGEIDDNTIENFKTIFNGNELIYDDDEMTDEFYEESMEDDNFFMANKNEYNTTFEYDENKEKEEREKYFSGDVFCLVGNIRDLREYGQNHELRAGIKNFAPGTKIYMSLSHWGDGGEQVPVLGKPRHKNGFIECIIRSEYICNYRVEKIYSPLLLKRMKNSKFDWWMNWSKEEIEDFAKDREKHWKVSSFNVTKEMLLKNLNNLKINLENRKRIANILGIDENKVLEYVRKNTEEADEINRVDKNFVIKNKNIKIIINAASFNVVTVKKIAKSHFFSFMKSKSMK